MYDKQEIKLVGPYVYGSCSMRHEISILNALFNQIVILKFHDYKYVSVLYIYMVFKVLKQEKNYNFLWT